MPIGRRLATPENLLRERESCDPLSPPIESLMHFYLSRIWELMECENSYRKKWWRNVTHKRFGRVKNQERWEFWWRECRAQTDPVYSMLVTKPYNWKRIFVLKGARPIFRALWWKPQIQLEMKSDGMECSISPPFRESSLAVCREGKIRQTLEQQPDSSMNGI